MFFYESDDGTQTKIESRNTNFLDQKFHSIWETMKDVEFFKVEDKPAPASKGMDPSVNGNNALSVTLLPLMDESQESWESLHG